MLRIPVAVMEIPKGRTVVEGDVMTLSMTREQALAAKFPSPYMDRVSQIQGRILKQPIKKGQPFEPTAFYPVGMGPDPTEELKPGERAVVIPFARESVDDQFLVPGSVVDVVFRANPDPAIGATDATVTLLSAVRILAVGKETVIGTKGKEEEGAAQQKRTVTFAVTQDQARAIKVVEGRGSMMIALRNKQDTALANRGGPTTLPGLLGLKEPARPFVSEIYRRGQYSAMTFAGGTREKIKLDPPYGLPVSTSPKGDKANEIEIWPYGWGWGGWPWGGYGGYRGTTHAGGTWSGWGGGWGGGHGWGR
jgi:Flp pilus assembly protein CpaB